MKRFAVLILMAVALALPAYPASSVTQTSVTKNDMIVISLAWTAHTDGSFTATTLTGVAATGELDGYYLYAMETDPGATAPQDNYDVALNDAHGLDILGTAGANRHTTNTQIVRPLIGSAATSIPIYGALQIAITGNNVNGAIGVIKLFFVKNPQ